MRRGPGIVRSNSSAVKDNVAVYWVSPAGDKQWAPDSRITEAQMRGMREYRHWRRFEANGVREIEKVSLEISKQLFEKQKKMKVQQHLREFKQMELVKANAKINKAKNYSKIDVEANEKTIQRIERAESNFLKMVVSEFDPVKRNTALSIEVRERSTSTLAGVAQKQEGLA